MNNLQKGVILTLLSAIFGGVTYLTTPIVLKSTNAETMLILWFLWANMIFIVFFLFTRKIKDTFKEFRKNLKKLALIGFINSISAIFWSYGILYGSSTSVAFIYRLQIIFTVILGLVFLKERLSKFEWFGILLAIIGTFIMIYQGEKIFGVGSMIALGGVIFSSIMVFLAKVYVKTINPISLAYSRSFFLLFFILIYALSFGELNFNVPINVYSLTFVSAISGAFLGFILFYKALSFYELSKASVIASIEPFFATLLIFIFLGLSPTINQIVGGILIVTGVVIVSLMGNKHGNTKNLKAK